jgi:hypothetical protein
MKIADRLLPVRYFYLFLAAARKNRPGFPEPPIKLRIYAFEIHASVAAAHFYPVNRVYHLERGCYSG